MSVWLGGLALSPTVNFDTRKWVRNTTLPATANVSTVVASITGGDTLDLSKTTAGRHETLYTLTPAIGQSSWTGDVRFTANTAGSDNTDTQQFNAMIWLNHDQNPTATGTTANGYVLDFTLLGARLRKFVAGTATTLSSSNVALDLTKRYAFRFNRTLTNVQARVWEYGTTEPSTWNVYDGAIDAAIPTGVGAVSQWRYSASKAGGLWSNLTYSAVGVRPYNAPITPRTFAGERIRSGRSRQSLTFGPLDFTQPSFITGTTTISATTLRTALTAAGSSTATLTFPAIQASAVDLLQLDLENFGVGAYQNLEYKLTFVGSSGNEYGLAELAGASGSTAAAPMRIISGSTSQYVKAQKLSNATEAAAHRNLRVAVLPRLGQVQIGEGDSGVYGGGWLDGAAITASLTPTLTLTAATSTAVTAAFTAIRLTVDLL